MDPQREAELKSQLRIVMMKLAQKPKDPELEERAEELYRKLREIDS